VFLSYARSSTRPQAAALHEALGGDAEGLAFLDSSDIEYDERFPPRLIDALFDAELIVVFADPIYFTRWYCLLELRAAMAPYIHLSALDEVAGTARLDALDSVLIVSSHDAAFDPWRLPPELRDVNRPSAGDSATIAALIRRRLQRAGDTLRVRLDATIGTQSFRRQWLEVTRVPPPERIPPDTPRIPLQGPPLSLHERFVGRANDLWRIHDVLTWRLGAFDHLAAMTVALEAAAGVGKTRLAIEYVHRFGPRHYPGGLFWLDASRPLEPQYYAVARNLNPEAPDWNVVRDEPDGVTGLLVKEFRAVPRDKPALVVLDNLPEPMPGEPPRALHDIFPALGDVAVLITARHRVALENEGAVARLLVNVLDEVGAASLLVRDIASTSLHDDEWREISTWVGRLPLALELLNRALATDALRPVELLEDARRKETTPVLDAAMEALRDIVPAGALRGVSEALAVSYDRLNERAQSAARLIAWLAPGPIPQALIDALGPAFAPPVRALLAARSIVLPAARATVPNYGEMHRVLSDYLRTTRRGDSLSEVHTLTLGIITVMTRDRVSMPSEWALMDACSPHAMALLSRLMLEQPRRLFVAQTAAVAVPLMSLLLAQGMGSEASALGQWVLPALVEEDDSGHYAVDASRQDVLVFLRILINALAEGNNLDAAISLQSNQVEFLGQHRNAGDPELLTERDNLALLLTQRGGEGDLDQARALYLQTIPEWRRRGPFSPDTLAVLHNFALLEGKRGAVDHGRTLFEQVLEGLSREKATIDLVKAQRNFAYLMWEADRPRGLGLLQDALTVADAINLPDRHPIKLDVLERLGETAHASVDCPRALALLRRVMDARSDTLGDQDEITGLWAWRLLDAAVRCGDVMASAEARKHLDWMMMKAPDELTEQQRAICLDMQTRGESEAHEE